MFNNALFRDIKIGIRVLIKEKGFCALAVIVLALGIAGVTTMFSVVNGVMLRGFSFPNGSRLVSLNFIDPTSATFFGVNGQVSSMDFEELLSAAEVLRRAGGLPERVDRKRHGRRTSCSVHRGLRHRKLPADSRDLPADGPRLHCRR